MRDFNKEIKQRCKLDKQQFYSDICKEIKSHNQNNQPGNLFRKTKYITRDFKVKNWAIEDHTGTLKTNTEEMAEVWRFYCQELYRNDQILEHIENYESLKEEPDILEKDVRSALNKLKSNKAPSSDLIIAQIIKHPKESEIKLLHLLCNKIW